MPVTRSRKYSQPNRSCSIGPPNKINKTIAIDLQGTLWIDKQNFHLIRAECEVMNAVPLFGILAKVLPGTHIELDAAPVTDSVWLINKLSLTLVLSKLMLFKSSEETVTTFSDYRPNTDVLAELLAGRWPAKTENFQNLSVNQR